MAEIETVFLTSKQLCDAIPMSDSSLRKYLENPKFPRYKVHDDLRFKLEEIVEFLRVKNEKRQVL